MRRLRVVFAMLLAAAAVGVGYLATTRPRVDPAATPVVRTTVAPVTRGTVTERVQVPGTLGYDGSYPVVNHLAPGVVTGLADLGATVNRGGTLYAVDNQAVRLLFGAVPAYRGFAAGMADGPDVAELEANLAALGFAPGTVVDNHFNAATAAAIRRWQASWGWPASARTGALAQGAVVFLPGLVRVSQLQGALGGGVGPGAPVLTATSVDRVVTAQVTADRQALVHVGDRVVVTMPGAAPVPGQVIRVGRVATAATQSGAGPPAPATLPVTVSVQLPSGAPDLDQAPVQVAIATRQHTDVLLVPVAALLAKPGGGYQVRLASGAFVPVQPGLFDETAGLVEVTGVHLGDQVEVPAP